MGLRELCPLDVLEYPMPYARFQGHPSLGSEEGEF